MTSTIPETTELIVRQCQRRDLEAIERLIAEASAADHWEDTEDGQQLQQLRRWYGVLKGLSLFPNPFQHLLSTYVAEQDNQLRGVIQVSPFNRTRSTWRVDRVLLQPAVEGAQTLSTDVGSQLVRHCLQAILEARTWLIEVEVNDSTLMALSRQSGFQPLAQMTYWAIAPELLEVLAEREPDLPNLLPVSNADACLLHQLDTVAMPPLVRQVFDRHITDFKTGFLGVPTQSLKRWFSNEEVVSGYVFEPVRKAAIGYFRVTLCRDGSKPHTAHLTVHPAYTWLYPELFAQMARVTRPYPSQMLCVASSDYQPEREEYLEQMGATRTHHTLMMSRSVWHKLREAKPLEGLQLSEVLQNLQPSRKPVPSRFSLIDSIRQMPQMQPHPQNEENSDRQ